MELSSLALCYVIIVALLYEFRNSIAGLPNAGAENEDAVQCGPNYCNISSAYGVWPDRTVCRAAQVLYPKTEEEILAAVSGAVRKKQKMKVVSRLAHSIPQLVCPGGSNGLVISTRFYNNHLVIDQEKMRVEVASGVELRPLIDGIARAGLALPHTPYWEGLSIGGLLSTGAHGSSFFGKGGAVHEYVVGMTLVVPASAEEGFAKVIEVTETDEELLNAAKVSLGVLGVISKVTLQLQPMFKRSITNEVLSDADLEERILPFASTYEFGDVLWHPSRLKAVYKKDMRVADDVRGDGVNDFLGFRPFDVSIIEGLRALETTFESTSDAEGKCIYARVQVATLLALGNGLKNNNYTFTGYPVIGYHNRLQASGSCLKQRETKTTYCDQVSGDMCPSADVDHTAMVAPGTRVCGWDRRVKGEFFHQTTLSIGVSKVRAFLRDVKTLRDVKRQGFCGMDLYYGVYLRFLKASSAFLGEQEDAVSVDITYYRSREAGRPRLLEDVVEEVEQMATFKYGGHPHWGKNRPVAFSRVWEKYPNLQKFLAIKDRLDPDALFSSEWSDAMLGVSTCAHHNNTTNPCPSLVELYTQDGCALEGLCVCSVDSHCAPHLGYFCQPGVVYLQARVCRKLPSTSIVRLM